MEDIPVNEKPLGRIGAPQQMTRNYDRHCDVISDVKREMHNADDVTLKCSNDIYSFIRCNFIKY